jgi:hypothetical protein
MDRLLTRRAATTSACAGALAVASAHRLKAQETASPAASPATTLLPDTPAGIQLAWVLAVINGDEPVPAVSGIEEHFAPVPLPSCLPIS